MRRSTKILFVVLGFLILTGILLFVFRQRFGISADTIRNPFGPGTMHRSWGVDIAVWVTMPPDGKTPAVGATVVAYERDPNHGNAFSLEKGSCTTATDGKCKIFFYTETQPTASTMFMVQARQMCVEQVMTNYSNPVANIVLPKCPNTSTANLRLVQVNPVNLVRTPVSGATIEVYNITNNVRVKLYSTETGSNGMYTLNFLKDKQYEILTIIRMANGQNCTSTTTYTSDIYNSGDPNIKKAVDGFFSGEVVDTFAPTCACSGPNCSKI